MNTLENQGVPQHLCIIMDGNRRWAKGFSLPVALGHAAGARRVKSIVRACADRGIKYLTLFAFSSENWSRPATEVSSLMGLLAIYLQKEVGDMHAQGVRLKVAGDVSRFDARIQALIHDAQTNTAQNDTITLTIAINYGGRWDCLQAFKACHADNPGLPVDSITEDRMRPYLAFSHTPDPDLLIRTGGEKRISNFMLWQLAYTELYFCDVLWPSFDEKELDTALLSFRVRNRRFGAEGLPIAANA
jgi:undecaprenyl diphosphate synthase